MFGLTGYGEITIKKLFKSKGFNFQTWFFQVLKGVDKITVA